MNQHPSVRILLAGLWLAGLSPVGASLVFDSFSGDLAPGNWTAQNYASASGTYVFNSPTTLQLSASADNSGSDIVLTSVSLSQISTIYLDWSVTPNGGNTPLAYYYEGSTQHDLIGSSGVINLVNVPSGTTLSFELASSGTTPGKDPVVFEVAVVPEPATWLAGAFLLGVIGFERWRRKSAAPAHSSS